MKKSTKAALLSGLVFPGFGHLYLKRWVAGVLLFGTAAAATYYIGAVVMGTVSVITEQIQSGAVPSDIDTITRLVTQETSGTEQSTNIAEMALMVCWVIGIVGSYIHGRAQDKFEAAPDVSL